jgi:hypothetical protein
MNGFQSPYFSVATADGHNFFLLENAIYISKNGTTYILPKGATSDGASTPQALWSTGLAPFGTYWKAAYLHDCAYRNTLLLADGKTPANLSFEDSNNLLKEAMELSGDGDLTIFNIYEGVALGGKSSFDNDRAKGAKAFMVII